MLSLLGAVWFCLIFTSMHTIVDGQQNTTLNKFEEMTQIVQKYGYPIETHEIETEDGYLLDVYRVPYGKSSTRRQPNTIPVILFHGLMGTSENFIIGGPKKAIVYMLADNGFDVWLLNARGTWHSRKHKTLDPDKDKAFWMFTFHELGYYDITATIDYITNVTSQSKMHFIGHSQGTTAFFAMAASRPEYNNRIRLMVALGPSAILRNMKHPILTFLAPMYPILTRLAKILGIYELVPRQLISNSDIRYLGKKLCGGGENTTMLDLCSDILFSVAGFEPDQLDPATIPLILSTSPAGASTFQALHYAQIITKGDFYQYDWGKKENLRKYGRSDPPKYDLKKVVAPVSLIYGENDVIVTKEDATILSTVLPNVVELYAVPYAKWTHNDFFWAKDVDLYLNNHIIGLVKKFNK